MIITRFTGWLDEWTGKFTMYRLVVLCLLALLLEAVLVSLAGGIFYNALQILASAAVVTVATVASNWIFGRIFRVRAQWESALITALIGLDRFTDGRRSRL